MTDHILVTGACGSIGKPLVACLLEATPFGVIGLDRVPWDGLSEPRFVPVQDDLRSVDYDNLLQGKTIRAIIHLGAENDERKSFDHVLNYHETNVTGTLRLLEFARRKDVEHFMLMSTGAAKLPDGVRTPRSPFVATKIAAENFAEVHSRLHGMAVSVFRAFDVYGHGVDSALQKFLEFIAGDSSENEVWRYEPFYPIHVDEVAHALVQAIGYRNAYSVYDLGSAVGLTADEIIGLGAVGIREALHPDGLQESSIPSNLPPDPSNLLGTFADLEISDPRDSIAQVLCR
jgi:nucleoside-diphosphate-sugar epimerase